VFAEKGWNVALFLNVKKTYTLLEQVLHQASDPEAERRALSRLTLDLPVKYSSVFMVSESSMKDQQGIR